MQSRCLGVSGGNESTMVRICSARAVSARWGVAGAVVLGGACVVGADCVREGGMGAGGWVGLISGAVVVGCACLALLRVRLLLSRCFEFLGLFVRCFPFLGGIQGCPVCLLRLWRKSPNIRTAEEKSVGFGCRVEAGFISRGSVDGCADVCCEVAAYSSCAAVVCGHVLAGWPAS